MERLYTTIDTVYAHTVERAFHMLKGVTSSSPSREFREPEVQSVIHLPGKKEETAPAPLSFKSVSAVIEQRTVSDNLANTVAYIGSTRAPVWNSPTREFDTVHKTLAYGTMVMALEEKGRFTRITAQGTEGWVLRDDISDRAAYVYPEFVVGEENNIQDPNTLRVRASIEDEFHGSEAEVPLQAGEYVLYRIMRKGKKITWPSVFPRIPGRWHQILRGTSGVRIGIAPKTGSIMECTLEHDMGHLAYVEAVFPGERITISEANYPDRGIYNERTLTKEEWQELNPVFIEVN